MELYFDVTDSHGVKITAIDGPLMASIILDVSDEEMVITNLRGTFAAAREHLASHAPPPVKPPRKRKAA